jgi:hypothetical protein
LLQFHEGLKEVIFGTEPPRGVTAANHEGLPLGCGRTPPVPRASRAFLPSQEVHGVPGDPPEGPLHLPGGLEENRPGVRIEEGHHRVAGPRLIRSTSVWEAAPPARWPGRSGRRPPEPAGLLELGGVYGGRTIEEAGPVQPRPEVGGSGQDLHRLASPVGERGGEIEAQPARGEPKPGTGVPTSPDQRSGDPPHVRPATAPWVVVETPQCAVSGSGSRLRTSARGCR